MKKIYLTALSVVLFFGANAQEKSAVTVKADNERSARNVRVPNVNNTPSYSTKATYLNEGFEGTFPPAGWSVYSGSSATTTSDPTQKWHLEAGRGNPGGAAFVSYVNSVDFHDEYMETPEVTLPSGACRLTFDFFSSIYWHAQTLGGTFDNVDLQVLISNDGGSSWDDIIWQEDSIALLDASQSNDWETFEWTTRAFVDLSSYSGDNVIIGFRYVGIDGAESGIDNVVIEDTPDNEIELSNGWSGDVVLDFDYSMVPDEQVKQMRVGAAVKNLGGMPQTFNLTADINDGSSSVYNNSQSVTLAVGESDTVWFDSGYTPTAQGVYTVSFSLPADDNLSNNNKSVTLTTTDFIYAHDFDGTQAFRFDQDDAVSMGNQFVMEQNATLRAANVEFTTGTTADLYVEINVWEVLTSIQDVTQVGVEGYTVPASAIGNSGLVTTIPFSTPISLTAGKTYILEVMKVDAGPSRMFLGGSDAGDDDLSTVCYGPFGTGSAVNRWIGWGFAPAIRMNFDATLGLNENPIEGVTIYPNPSEGIVNISNDKNITNNIEVFDLLGNSILSTSASTATTIDLTGNASGVYVVVVSNSNGSVVERVSIK